MVTKFNLNFVVEDYGNPKMLVLTDLSQYPKNPEKPIWQITLPGFDKAIELLALPNKSMYIDSNLLGFSTNVAACDLLDLPDGIWSICYKICPYDELFHCGYFYKTASIEKQFDTLLANLTVDANGEFSSCSVSDVESLSLLIESCKACARLGYKDKAVHRYTAATKLLNKLKFKNG